MGTFKDSLKKWFYTEDTSPSVGDTTRIPLLDASGEPIGSRTLQDLQMVYPTIGNIAIISVLSGETACRIYPLSKATATAIQRAIGVGVIENGRLLIIAKDSLGGMQWATSGVSGGTTYIADSEAARMDFDGRTKTATIYSTLGNNAPAAKACLEYTQQTLTENARFCAGRWWLPSMGECVMMWAHFDAINFAMGIIGGTPLEETLMSSTERNSDNFYRVSELWGNVSKTSTNYAVRPVTSLYA